jgi:AcrR family transcriptional regulator
MRNRDETRQHILDSAIAALSDEGFAAFGINSVARRAGYDKKLIYRYFDGMDGLVAAIGQSVADGLALALTPHLVPPPPSYAALIERLALALFDHLWDNQRFRQLRLMEAAAPSIATNAFRAARGNAMQDWMRAARGELVLPKGDISALNASLIAMIEGITVLGAVGMDPADAATRERLMRSVTAVARAVLANPPDDQTATNRPPAGS